MPSYIRTRSEFTVNSYGAGDQVAPSVATFADGSFIVVWITTDPTQDGDDQAIKAQRFDSNGIKVGAEFLVNSSAGGAQFSPEVATLSNGNFVVTWVTNISDDGSDGIKAQLFSASGQPIGAEFKVNLSTGSHFTSNVSPLADGGFVISWDDWNGFDMKAQIFDAGGARVGGVITVNTRTDYFQEYGDIVGLAGGGFVATWRTTDGADDGSGHAVKAQVFDSNGAKVGAEFLVNTQKTDNQYGASIEALAGGGFVIVWETWDTLQDGSSSALKGQIFSASGAKIGAEFRVNTQAADMQRDPHIAGTSDGGFVVSWTDFSSTQDGSQSSIKVQAFDSSGAKVGGEMLLNTLTAGYQTLSDIDTLADGRLIVTWTSDGGDGAGRSIRAQILGTQVAPPLPNMAPAIISNGGGASASLTQDEGVSAVTTVVASDDGDATALRYSISGGSDAALFTINALTGALAFKGTPDHVEGGDNVYDVTVTASDGQLSDSQALQITLRHVNYVTIVSDGGYDYAYVYADENQRAVTTVSAVDDDGAALSYTITGGEDADLFVIDAQTGELKFAAEPDYEAPVDQYGDNVYYVVVTVSDGVRSDSQEISVYINNLFEQDGFAITSNGGGDQADVTVAENLTEVTTVAVSGAAGPVVFEIDGGYDAYLFTIDAATGQLSFLEAPDYENPPYYGWGSHYSYYGGYQVVVKVTDGESVDYQELKVVVANVDEAPVFYSYWGESRVELSMQENSVESLWIYAEDPDGGTSVSYSLAGADAALFNFDPNSGELSFRAAPDFEAPADADGDHVYEVAVVASSDDQSSTQAFSILIWDQYENVSITSFGGADSAIVSTPENQLAVTTITAGGNGPIFYDISGGADASWFTIDRDTGVLSFRTSPNYESVKDLGHNAPSHGTTYDVIVRAWNGGPADEQRLSVRVTDVDEAPVFSGYGGLANVALSLSENLSVIGTVRARDPDRNATITYALTGADASLFKIDLATGVLEFIQARDFEAPADSNLDNVYQVTVVATSGALSASQSFSIAIQDVNENVTITSNGGGDSASLVLAENVPAVTTVSATGPGSVTYSIAGGADALYFIVNAATGALAFAYPSDFEGTGDADHDNVYEVVVRASNGLTSDDQQLSITLTDVDEDPDFYNQEPGVIEIWMGENSPYVGILNAYDVDGGPPISYSITGGADGTLFTIDPVSGELWLVDTNGVDFEAPGDADGDNVYQIEVTATAGAWSRARDFKVTLVDENEPIVITSNGGGTSAAIAMAEGSKYVTTVVGHDPDGLAPLYSIVGGPDSARFTIDPATGVLSFRDTPDFEAPADSAGANFYTVKVAASDGLHSAWQTVQILVGNVNEGVTITSAAAYSTLENGTAVTTIAASDVDGDPVGYAIAGGADAALFTIDAQTGALSFRNAPNFEAPADSGGDNVYDVIVSATDGSFTDSKALAVTVGNVNEAVFITSNGGGASAGLAVAENGVAVTVVAATDTDGGPVTYAIAGGADAARFRIDATTGVLTFVTAPNFEAPADSGANNVYDVIVSASDGSLTDTQALAVSVDNVNEVLFITSNGGGSTAAVTVAENSTGVTNVIAADPDGTAATYSIVGGADAARFTINPQTGALQFVAAPDWELPGDSNQDNVYSVVVRASDGQYSDDQVLSVSIGNVVDGNNVIGTSGGDSISATSSNPALRTSNEEDTVFGRDGHDTILGMAGDDELYGEAGNDTLTGGAGADRLTGGLGKDTFTYNLVSDSTASSRDQILDFSRAQGDKISLSAIDANANAANNQAFAFIGTAAFSNVAGQLRYETSGGVTTISGDVNGDGIADLQILVSGSLTMVASDFVL